MPQFHCVGHRVGALLSHVGTSCVCRGGPPWDETCTPSTAGSLRCGGEGGGEGGREGGREYTYMLRSIHNLHTSYTMCTS